MGEKLRIYMFDMLLGIAVKKGYTGMFQKVFEIFPKTASLYKKEIERYDKNVPCLSDMETEKLWNKICSRIEKMEDAKS